MSSVDLFGSRRSKMANVQDINDIPHLVLEHESDVRDYEVIDVRRPDEFTGELGHIEGARLVTLGADLEQFFQGHDKNSKVLFVCRSGARSAQATQLALDHGFKIVANMAGGMIRWNELGFKSVKE